MKYELSADGKTLRNDYLDRTERIDGPEIEDFTPTIQELVQLVKFHIQELIEMHWHALTNDLVISTLSEDAIWLRLEKIRRVLGEDDFKYTVDLACIQFGLEVDLRLWQVFLYGDEALRRDTASEIRLGRGSSGGFSAKLERRIAEAALGQKQEIPREILRRMALPIRGSNTILERFWN